MIKHQKMQLQWVNIKSPIKHDLCDNTCDPYWTIVDLLYASHHYHFLLSSFAEDVKLFWYYKMNQHYIARRGQGSS